MQFHYNGLHLFLHHRDFLNNPNILYLYMFFYLSSFHIDGLANPGNPIFASIRAQEGKERSRRDDIESIAYILMYFASRGNLPWIETIDTE